MKNLPSIDQTFSAIIKKNLIYVDKTKYIYDLIDNGVCYFLSRPRLFGKTLLIDAMEELFQGQRELFRGLWIESSDYDFKKRPVVRLNMDLDCRTMEELRLSLVLELDRAARKNGLKIQGDSPGNIIEALAYDLKRQSGQRIAVLIDDYDAPILSQIGNVPLAEEIRRELVGFYVSLKTLADMDCIQFLFVTGLSNLAKASGFLAFNNMADLTFHYRYHDICGFTLDELDSYFAEYLKEALEYGQADGSVGPQISPEEFRLKVLDFYGGYSWDGEKRILNPFSLICFLGSKEMRPYWYQRAAPDFLENFVKKYPLGLSKPYSRTMTKSTLWPLELKGLSLKPLLFQEGCLAIHKPIVGNWYDPTEYLLREPNLEVAAAFNAHVLAILTGRSQSEINEVSALVVQSLESFDRAGPKRALRTVLRYLPGQLPVPLERYCQAIVFSILASFNLEVASEGDLLDEDMATLAVWPSGQVWAIEFMHEKLEWESSGSQEDPREGLPEGPQADAPARGNKDKKMAAGPKLALRAARRALSRMKKKGYAEGYLKEGRAVKMAGVGLAGRTYAAVLME